MKKVGVSGANGKMGRLTIGAVDACDDLALGGLYAPGRDGQDILGYIASDSPDVLAQCDVIIELTNPEAADANVLRWRDNGADVVVGTSGYTRERLDTLRDAWAGHDTRCLVVPNFAVGAVLMMRFAELAAPYFESAEIVEMHHDTKPDAPSGTALHTAQRMAAARDSKTHERGNEIISGALGAEVEGIPVHSLRMRGTAAHQEVVLGTVGQYLTIRHDTTDYGSFSPGILLALRESATLKSGVSVGLEQLLGI